MYIQSICLENSHLLQLLPRLLLYTKVFCCFLLDLQQHLNSVTKEETERLVNTSVVGIERVICENHLFPSVNELNRHPEIIL